MSSDDEAIARMEAALKKVKADKIAKAERRAVEECRIAEARAAEECWVVEVRAAEERRIAAAKAWEEEKSGPRQRPLGSRGCWLPWR